jgi:hypothetical protein
VGNVFPDPGKKSGGAAVLKWKVVHGSGIFVSIHLSPDCLPAQADLPIPRKEPPSPTPWIQPGERSKAAPRK